eukprot:Pgem_evm1s16847
MLTYDVLKSQVAILKVYSQKIRKAEQIKMLETSRFEEKVSMKNQLEFVICFYIELLLSTPSQPLHHNLVLYL